MSNVSANRLHDLAVQLKSYEQRGDGYNYRVIDDAFVARMRDGKATRADYDHLKAATDARTSSWDHVADATWVDPQDAPRRGFNRDLTNLRVELAKTLSIKEPLFPELAGAWASLRGALSV